MSNVIGCTPIFYVAQNKTNTHIPFLMDEYLVFDDAVVVILSFGREYGKNNIQQSMKLHTYEAQIDGECTICMAIQ